jgi:hypothetical protein
MKHTPSWNRAWPVLGLVLCLTGTAAAGRVPTIRSTGFHNNGTRIDITVPYLNNGRDAFNANGVAPRVYSTPVVNEIVFPGVKPVFNLPFYGGILSFGDYSTGATPRSRTPIR